MKQLRDEDLILYYYDEADDAAEIQSALASSPELRSRYEALRETLDAAGTALAVPARPASYGAEVWDRLRPRLDETPSLAPPGGGRLLPFFRARGGRVLGNPWFGIGLAAVLLLAVGFLAGRLWPPAGQGEQRTAEVLHSAARERILSRTVAAHLESSERLLTELSNSATDGAVDVSAERRWAQDLLDANRLYRQSAKLGGRPRLAFLLDDLEPFLLELAHGPAEIPADELEVLRSRIEEQALLFKMRVTSQRLERASMLVRTADGKQTL